MSEELTRGEQLAKQLRHERVDGAVSFTEEQYAEANKFAVGYKKFLEENRELILETAMRHGIDSVVALMSDGEKSQESEESFGIDQMSVVAAKELFEIQSKTTGVKILRYKGSETVVDIPRVIGKTAVALGA